MANKPLQTIKFPGLTDTYTVPQVDSNFVGTAGKVPDSKKVKDEISSVKEELNDITGLVNYGYDTPFHRDPDPSGSAYLHVGVDRSLTKVVLNGTVPTGDNLRVKLSGDVSVVASSGSVEAWTGIELADGHEYIVKCKHISGTMTAIYVSVYEEGSHTSIGERTTDGNTYTLTFTADGAKRYNIALYLPSDSTYVDATYLVTLTDVLESEIEALSKDVATAKNDIININDELDVLYRKQTMASLFEQGGYNRRGGRLGTTQAAAYLVTTGYSSDDLCKVAVTDDYRLTLIAFNSDGTFYGFLVDDYTLSNVATDNVYWTQELLMSKYYDLFPALNFKIEITNTITATTGTLTNIVPSEAVNATGYFKDSVDGIKSYYETEMTATLASVRASVTEPALVFPLVTDIHYQSVNDFFDDCADNIKEFASKIRCDFVLNLGDDTDGNVAQDITLSRAYHMRERFAEIDLPYYHAIGNHDTNYYQSAPVFSSNQIFSAYLSNTRGVTYNMMSGEKDYYKDFDELGIRLIVLDGNHGGSYRFSANTATWLTNVALVTDHIVIIGVHFSPIIEQNWGGTSKPITYATAVAAAIQAFVDNGGTVIQFCGHSHADYHFDTPWLSIHNNCQKFEQSDLTTSGFAHLVESTDDLEAPARTAGTATEDCWSVVVVKPISRTVDVIRFGAGNDRSFTF